VYGKGLVGRYRPGWEKGVILPNMRRYDFRAAHELNKLVGFQRWRIS
jgi:hypothetical protein